MRRRPSSGASGADGATVIQWPSTGGTNQQWKLPPNVDGSYRLVNVRSGKVLDSPGGSAEGAALDQWTDTDSSNQWWNPVPASSGYHRLVDVGNGWCADVKDASTADGATVVQWPNTGQANQEWQVIALWAAMPERAGVTPHRPSASPPSGRQAALDSCEADAAHGAGNSRSSDSRMTGSTAGPRQDVHERSMRFRARAP